MTQLFVPIISIDHLSQHVGDMHYDHILALGDQKLLRKLAPDQMSEAMLSQDITEPVVFGPLINDFYGMLYTLKRRLERGESCEMLLYLSGHGMKPCNIHYDYDRGSSRWAFTLVH